MVKPLRAALILGAGYAALKYTTKEPLLTDENIRNGTIGAVGGITGIPKLEQLAKGELPEDEKGHAKRALYGAVSGALLTTAYHYLTSRDVPGKVAEGAKDFYKKHLSSD